MKVNIGVLLQKHFVNHSIFQKREKMKTKTTTKVIDNLVYSETIATTPLVDLNEKRNYQSVLISNKIVRANQSLGLNEKRLIACCIAQITPDDRMRKDNFRLEEFLERRKFKITVEHFSTLFDYRQPRNAYRDLRSAAKTLFERSSQIKFEKSEEYVRFVDRIRYDEASVELCFTPDMYLYLFELDGGYTQYNLKIGAGFKSMYAHRIFELLQSRKDTNTVILSNKELRFILNIPDSYKNYGKIKEKVFQPTALEFAKYGMTLEIEIRKDKDGEHLNDIIILKANKNVNDIVEELGLTEQNFLKSKLYSGLDERDFQLLSEAFPKLSVADFKAMKIEDLRIHIEQMEMQKLLASVPVRKNEH